MASIAFLVFGPTGKIAVVMSSYVANFAGVKENEIQISAEVGRIESALKQKSGPHS